MSTKKIKRQLRDEFPFADIGYTGKGHFKLTLPNSKIVTVSCSPSDDVHFLRNVRADVRRTMKGGTDGK